MVSRTYVLGLALVVMFIAAPAQAGPIHDAAENGDIEEVNRLSRTQSLQPSQSTSSSGRS